MSPANHLSNLIGTTLKTLIIVFILLLPSAFAKTFFPISQVTKNINFSHFDAESNLPHPSINAIEQDSQGYIWIATQGGLVRYDGIHAKTYTNNKNDLNSIGNNWIYALLTDSSGRLWVTSDGGIHLYIPEQDNFLNFKDSTYYPEIAGKSYSAIAEDHAGNIWFASRYAGLTKYNVKTSQFVVYNKSNSKLSSNNLTDIQLDHIGRIWISTNDSQINIYDHGINDFTQLKESRSEYSSAPIKTLFIDKSNTLWAGSRGQGLYAINTETHSIIQNFTVNEQNDNSICDNDVNDIIQDSKSRLWIATNNGLCMYDEAIGGFIRHSKSLSNIKSLINNRVTSLFEDDGGVIWIGTHDGISYWNGSLDYFTHISQRSEFGQLSASSILSFAAMDNKLYVGTWEGGINVLDFDNKNLSIIRAQKGKEGFLQEDTIMSLMVDSNKGLWAGTFGNGLFYREYGQENFIQISHIKNKVNSISDNSISKIIELKNGNVAIATYGGGLNILNPETFDIKRVTQSEKHKENVKLTNLIVDLTEDEAGNIWLATREGGVSAYSPQEKRLVQYLDPKTDAPLISQDVFSVITDKKYVWVATSDSGVARINRSKFLKGELEYITLSLNQGLASNFSYGLIKADDGTIWVSHSKGLSRIKPENLSIDNFNTTHGLQGSDFNSSAFYKAQNGQMFFGGTNGFNTFSPNNIPINNYKPPLRLTKFSHGNVEKPIQNLLRKDGVLELNYKETILDFEFAALDFTKPTNNRYQYMMEGLSDVWLNLGTNNHISFSYLADGEYKLRVRGSNNEVVWSDEIVIPIEVLPPIWLSWYAYIAYVLIVLLAILSVLRQQQIKHQRQLSHERRLHQLAYYDSLTGLPNRQSFYENLEKFISLAKRGNYQAGVMFIDLDRFKRINDTLGHDYGDKVLQEVAIRLKESVRDSDIVARNFQSNAFNNEIARLGGDEFTLFLSHIESADETTAVTQRIIDSLSKPIQIDNYELTITPSIGIAMYPENGSTVNELMKHADIAMYQAKEDGRRTFKFYSNSSNDRALERLQLEEYMRSAVKNHEFVLYYQPQVDLEKNRITKAEALIRWIHPDLGFIPPDDFISIAEESGLIIELGDWILDTACMQAKAWLDAGIENCRVSVNVSSVQFKQTALIDKVKSALDKSQLPPHLLELELTESAVMSDVEDNIERLQQFKEMGITVAVDDFGTGYSSLSYLKKFPIDTLKIDRSFIDEIATSENDVAIVKAIMVLAETMGLNVVAEGIETIEQLKILNDFGCQHIQGYYFSKPLPNVDFVDFVERQFFDKKSMWKLEMLG